MLTELCQELRNWFDNYMPKFDGEFVIENGELVVDDVMDIKQGQYYRIVGSVFNDGVHKLGDGGLTDETFTGWVWAMAVPLAVIALADEIDAWQAKYGGVDSQAMSPFSSESFGGYSYTKSSGGYNNSDMGGYPDWRKAFAKRLNMWRKI